VKKRTSKSIIKPEVAVKRVTGLSPSLVRDVRTLIESARSNIAQTVNSELVALYWQIGTRIRQDVLREKRAEYGKEIVSALSRQLSREYGDGFSEKSLRHMVHFAQIFADPKIVSALRRKLSWSHIKEIIYLPDPLQREFYIEMTRLENWSTRTLHERIQSMLYERTAISKKPTALIKQELAGLREKDAVTPDLVFRDPYILSFLNLADTYSEKDLESAILREIERFVLELGEGFSFVARQKRIAIDHQDYVIDLVFFHRRLKCLVAIDLKLGRFQAADKGQLELYLNWLDKHERCVGENSPIGLILCAGKSDEHVELLRLANSGIRVAEYMTALPAKSLLQKKLHQAVRAAKARLISESRQ